MSQIIIEDAGWKAIMADERLKRARSKLSFHELRLIIGHARASVGRNAERQDRNGLGPKDEHAVAATGGETPTTRSSGESSQ